MHNVIPKSKSSTSLLYIVMMGLFLLLFTGCGGGGDTDPKVTVSGLVQKGQFISGNIRVEKLDVNADLLDTRVHSDISSKGDYSLILKEQGISHFVAKGKFFNEYTGLNSLEEAELYALADFSQVTESIRANVNLFTSLEAKRILFLMKSGLSFEDAKTETRKSLEDTLGIPQSVDLSALDIFDTTGTLKKENISMLLFSAALLKLAESESTASLKQTAVARVSLGSMLRDLYSDFEDDGRFNGAAQSTFQRMRGMNPQELWDRARVHLPVGGEVEIPVWILDVSISSLILDSVTVDSIKKEYVDEEALFIALANNDATIKLFVTYTKKDETFIPDITIYALSGANTVALTTEILGARTTPGSYRKEINIDVNAQLRTFLRSAYDNNENVTFKVTVDTANNTLDTLPVFAENKSKMNPNTEISSETYKGICSGETAYRFAKMDISGTVYESAVDYTDVCVELVYDPVSKYFFPFLNSGVGNISETIHITLGDNDLAIDAPTIDKDDITVNRISLNLPVEHSIHDRSYDGNTVSAFGTNTIILNNPQNNKISNDENIYAMSFSGTLTNKYLHGKNLPFYFRLDGYTLDTSGLLFSRTEVKYVFDYANSKKNNTERFSDPTDDAIDIFVSATGITSSSNLLFSAVNSMQTNYPQATMNTGAFTVSVANSEITPVSTQNDSNILMTYDKNCKKEGCLGATTGNLILKEIISSTLYANGSVISKQSTPIGPVSWGYNGADTVFSRKEDIGAQVYIPGYEIPTDNVDKVSSYLLGTLEETATNTSVQRMHDATESELGRFLFAGINVGKLQIDGLDLSAAPGISLVGKGMGVKVGFPAEEKVLTSNDYSKYYVRPSGVTGVFNRNPEAFDLTVYDYDLNFSQFAFRQVSNKIDEYSLINGSLIVPGKGDFTVVYNSLGLDCTGSFNNGLVVPCYAEVEGAVNCSETLGAWRIATGFTNIGFVGEGECAVSKKLEVGHILDVIALKDKIGLTTIWEPTGTPTASRVSGSAYNQMDGNRSLDSNITNGGYDIAFDDTVKLASQSDKDWFEANVKFGLPFWNATNMSVRLSNSNKAQKEASVVVAKDALSGFDMSKSNADIVKDIQKDYNQTVNYSWAGGLIKFGMPVYYDATVNALQIPKFLGRMQTIDLKVMKANSGVDYIAPDSTSMSFGASADFEALGKMKLHIDLNDPDSLKEIDNVLIEMSIVSRNSDGTGPFEASVGEVVSNIRIGNKLLGQGLTLSMEKGAILALEKASQAAGSADPFENIAQIVSEVHALPALINDRVEEEVKGRITYVLNSAFTRLGETFAGATPEFKYREFAEENNESIQNIINALTMVDEGIEDYEKTISFLRQMISALDTIDNLVGYIDTSKTELEKYFVPQNGGSCSWDYTTNQGIFKPIGDADKAITKANKKLQDFKISKIEDIAKKVNTYTGLDSKDLVSLAKKIKKWSDKLDKMVSDESGFFHENFNTYICDNVTTIQEEITDITERTRTLVTMRTELSTTIINIHDIMKKEGEIGAKVYALQDLTSALRSELSSMYTDENPMADGALSVLITAVSQGQANSIASLRRAVVVTVNDALDTNVFDKTEAMVQEFENKVPNLSASDMRRLVVTKLFATQGVQDLNADFQKMLTPIADEVNKIAMSLLGGLDRSLNKLLAKVSDKVNKTLSKATSKMTNAIPVKAAKMDGYAIIRGERLSQAHIGSEFEVKGSSKKTSFTLNAALDIWNNEANDTAGCEVRQDEAGNLNVQISTRDITMPLGEKKLSVDLVLLGVTINGDGFPVGIFGAITSKSGFDFEALELYNMGLATGIGSSETYLGAMANAKMDDVLFGVNFLIGSVCNPTVQKAFIPKRIYEFITIPPTGFNGGLVYGEAQVPVWKNGCMLTVNARAKIGAWYLLNSGSSDIYGGIVGGGIFGKGLCIATIGGEMEALAEKNGDRVRFQGSGWGAAGVGWCDNSWSSVRDSRKDSWCGTGDAQFGAKYDNGWELLKIDYSAVH